MKFLYLHHMKPLLKQIIKLFKRNSFIETNYNQPKQIDGKVNGCYVYEISTDTEIEIIDDLRAVETSGPIIYDVYWQNTDDTSELTFSFNGNTITLWGDTPDLTTQNHTIFVRHPQSTSNGIISILESYNKVMGAKRINIKLNEVALPPTFVSAVMSADNTYVDITFSEGVGANLGATLPLLLTSLNVSFDNGGTGTATDWVKSSLKQNDDTVEGNASALVGGETVIRMFGSSVGTPNGDESITIIPASGTSIGGINGAWMSGIIATEVINLNEIVTLSEITFPTLVNATKSVLTYTATGSNGSGLSDLVKPLNATDYELRYEIVDLGIQTFGIMATNVSPTAFTDFQFAIQVNAAGNLRWGIAGAFTDTGVAMSVGYLLRLNVVANTMSWEYSTNGGSSWTSVKTNSDAVAERYIAFSIGVSGDQMGNFQHNGLQ